MFFEKELASLGRRGLLRELHSLPKTAGGGAMLNFSTNDYLGLASDARVKKAAAEAVERYGCGAGASRLMAGNLDLHELLERDLAAMMHKEAALVFGSGYLTNLGILSTLGGDGDAIFSDELNHASLIDGIRLSPALHTRYKHADLGDLENKLKQKVAGKRIIVSESLFSMDGDIAPLSDLSRLAGKYDAMLVIDEAHAIGVFGAEGGGLCRLPGSEVDADIVIGTLSKGLGGYGGYVACSESARRYFINKARSFIFSTGLPPGCLGSAREAIAIVRKNPDMGKDLLCKARRFSKSLAQAGLRICPVHSQIIPVLVGANESAVQLAEQLGRHGLLVRAVRPPTVPAGTARIRLSLTLNMDVDALDKAAQVIAETSRQLGVA